MAVDFFGRPIAARFAIPDDEQENDESLVSAPPARKRAKIVYKYHEGELVKA